METITFDQLPYSVTRLHEKLDHIEQLLREANNHSPEIDELLTITQAAKFLHLSTPTIYGKVSRNEIPVNKQGKRLYFYRSELAEWIKSGRKKTLTEIKQEADEYLGNRKRVNR
jgi:excisionase family DNA binding protein